MIKAKPALAAAKDIVERFAPTTVEYRKVSDLRDLVGREYPDLDEWDRAIVAQNIATLLKWTVYYDMTPEEIDEAAKALLERLPMDEEEIGLWLREHAARFGPVNIDAIVERVRLKMVN